jgi:hypothetical protein
MNAITYIYCLPWQHLPTLDKISYKIVGISGILGGFWGSLRILGDSYKANCQGAVRP